jgi:Tfp pilus assembly protein PilO
MTGARLALFHVIRHPAVLAAGLSLAVALALLAAAAVFVWQPVWAEAEDAAERLDRAALHLRELRYRARLAQDYAARLVEAEALEGKLRQAKSEPVFVRDLEALAGRSGVGVEQVSASREEKSGGIDTAFLELILKGPYTNIRQFVSGLPELHEFVAVERISLERDGETIRAILVLKRRHKAD